MYYINTCNTCSGLAIFGKARARILQPSIGWGLKGEPNLGLDFSGLDFSGLNFYGLDFSGLDPSLV